MTDLDRVVGASNGLTARWAAALPDGRSTVLSGAGLWPILALLAASADGRGRTELEGAIDFPADGAETAARALLDALRDSPTVKAALGIWARADVAFTDRWTRSAPPGVRGELTGNPAIDQPALDAWAARETAGLIERMPIEVDAETLMVLATALMVRTTWRAPFEDGPASVPAGPWASRLIAALSRRTTGLEPLSVASTDAGLVTTLAVEGTEDVDVHLVLGEEGRASGATLSAGIATVGGAFPTIRGDALLADQSAPGLSAGQAEVADGRPRLMVRTARFTVEGQHDLVAQAPLFGLATVSDSSRGRFPLMSSTPLAVDQARQVATATFSAEGFVAAAITAFGMQRAAALPLGTVPMIVVTFDRPFGFVAVHRPTHLVLVAGWVTEPEDQQP
jgi:serine protease inhibitor